MTFKGSLEHVQLANIPIPEVSPSHSISPSSSQIGSGELGDLMGLHPRGLSWKGEMSKLEEITVALGRDL